MTCVSCVVGSGKSSLLCALLGELLIDPGSAVEWRGQSQRPRLAYCAQRPWIVATTVKANVVMAGVISEPKSGDDSGDDNLSSRRVIYKSYLSLILFFLF